jgi:hypothetical protein
MQLKESLMMNVQIPKAKWNKMKIDLENAWDEISAEEVERTHGSVKSIYGLVQTKCGLAEFEVKDKLMAILRKYDEDPNTQKSA